jgi:hypothetical protein
MKKYVVAIVHEHKYAVPVEADSEEDAAEQAIARVRGGCSANLTKWNAGYTIKSAGILAVD